MNSPGDSSALIGLQASHLLRRNNKLGHRSYFHMHSGATSHGEGWQGGWGSAGAALPRIRQGNNEHSPQKPLRAFGKMQEGVRGMRCSVSQGQRSCCFLTWAQFWFNADCPRTETHRGWAYHRPWAS